MTKIPINLTEDNEKYLRDQKKEGNGSIAFQINQLIKSKREKK